MPDNWSSRDFADAAIKRYMDEMDRFIGEITRDFLIACRVCGTLNI